MADVHSCIELRCAAETYILSNFQSVSNGDEFLQLPLELFLHFLRSDDLCIESEFQVLDSAIRWVMAELPTRRRQIYDIMTAVRLPLIPSSLLNRLIVSCSDPGVQIVLQKLSQDLRRPSGLAVTQFRCQPRRLSRRMLYVVGGYQRSAGTRWSDSRTISQVDCYDTFLRLWRTAPPLRTARSGCGVIAADGAIYAVGGESDSLIYDSTERFEPGLSSRWRTFESMTTPRCGAGICTVGTSLYVFGGWVGSVIGNSVEVYDWHSKSWSECDTMRGELRHAMGIVEYQGEFHLSV